MKWSVFLPAAVLALGILLSAPGAANAGSDIKYDKDGRPYVVVKRGGKHVRSYCRKAFFGVYRCPGKRQRARYGPYDRDFAFGQGYQIKR